MTTDDLVLDLETDKVLSEGQLLRHYGHLFMNLPSDIHIFSAFLATTHHSMTYREVRFFTLERKQAQRPADISRHLAGVAEMRRLLRVHRDQWRAGAPAYFASGQPDAIWASPRGDVAIEYDAGSYSPQRIRQKMYAFERYEGQVWGSSSQRRVEHLKEFLQEKSGFSFPLFALWY